ncbi:hypothetical protein DFQ13_11842 [Actinokineospora spheciospongiae]|nr:hypothetical protein DFQ13_11842 [Actinokineospora spheciospongiae]
MSDFPALSVLLGNAFFVGCVTAAIITARLDRVEAQA